MIMIQMTIIKIVMFLLLKISLKYISVTRGVAEQLSLTSGENCTEALWIILLNRCFQAQNKAFKMEERGKGNMKIPVRHPSFHISLFGLLSLSVSGGKWLRSNAGVIFCHQSISGFYL